jgi:hypothetical protein
MKGRTNMIDKLQCFFSGISYGELESGKPVGVIGFAIPDLGVIFKSKWHGSLYECQYAGLLSLLSFIEANHKSMDVLQFEILTDSVLLVHQISYRRLISPELEPLYQAAINFKTKIDYRISWVPRNENMAIVGLGDSKPYKADIDLTLEINPRIKNSIYISSKSKA